MKSNINLSTVRRRKMRKIIAQRMRFLDWNVMPMGLPPLTLRSMNEMMKRPEQPSDH